MKTIREYLETLFINLPETEEIMAMKEDLLGNMEDKYSELQAEGKTENEAIGTVIAEFGNIDELLEAMDMEDASEKYIPSLPVVTEDVAMDYIETKRKIGLGIGIGVLLCGIGMSLFIVMEAYMEFVPLVASIVCIATGVGFFILSGFRAKRYEEMEKSFVLEASVKKKVAEMKQTYEKSHIICIVMGVFICILALLPVILFSNDLSGTALMIVLGCIGAFFFIYTGNRVSSFDLLLQNGKEKQPTPKKKEQKKTKYSIKAIYWPIVICVYFSVSFVLNAWSSSWLIIVIAGVLSNAIFSIVD